MFLHVSSWNYQIDGIYREYFAGNSLHDSLFRAGAAPFFLGPLADDLIAAVLAPFGFRMASAYATLDESAVFQRISLNAQPSLPARKPRTAFEFSQVRVWHGLVSHEFLIPAQASHATVTSCSDESDAWASFVVVHSGFFGSSQSPRLRQKPMRRQPDECFRRTSVRSAVAFCARIRRLATCGPIRDHAVDGLFPACDRFELLFGSGKWKCRSPFGTQARPSRRSRDAHVAASCGSHSRRRCCVHRIWLPTEAPIIRNASAIIGSRRASLRFFARDEPRRRLCSAASGGPLRAYAIGMKSGLSKFADSVDACFFVVVEELYFHVVALLLVISVVERRAGALVPVICRLVAFRQAIIYAPVVGAAPCKWLRTRFFN